MVIFTENTVAIYDAFFTSTPTVMGIHPAELLGPTEDLQEAAA